MAGERDLKPAAQRRAVDGGNGRLMDLVEKSQDFAKPGGSRRLAEFGDVGAGDKGASLAAYDDRPDVGSSRAACKFS